MITDFVYTIESKDDSTEEEYLKTSILGNTLYKMLIMFCTSCLCILPLNLMKDISKLRFSTILGLCCLTVTVFVIVFQLPQFYKNYIQNQYVASDSSTHINWYDVSQGFDSNLNFFRATATILFAYNCHYGAFPIYDKLADNNQRRTDKVIFRSSILDCVFFVIVGVAGYLTQPINTPPLILSRAKLPDSQDYIMNTCRLLIALVLIVKIPINFNSFRLSILNLIFNNPEVTTAK